MIKKIFGILALFAIAIVPMIGLAQTQPYLLYVPNVWDTASFTAKYEFHGHYSQPVKIYAWVGEYNASNPVVSGWTKDLFLTTVPGNDDPLKFEANFNFHNLGFSDGKTYGYLLADRTAEAGMVPFGQNGSSVTRCFNTTQGDVACPTAGGSGAGGTGTGATFNYVGAPTVSCDDELEICNFKVLVQPTTTGTLKLALNAYPKTNYDSGGRNSVALSNERTISVIANQQSQQSISVSFSEILSFTRTAQDPKFYFNFSEAQSNKLSTFSSFFDSVAQGISTGGSGSGGGSLCGSAANHAATGQPTSGLCVPGSTTGSVIPDGTEWAWLCIPANGVGGEDCRTSATGGAGGAGAGGGAGSTNACGTANGGTFATQSLITGTLCGSGSTASAITGSGPWTWTCGTANCTANIDGGDNRGPNFLKNPLAPGLDTFPKIFAAVYNGIILPVAIPFIAIAIMYSGFLFVIARRDGNSMKLDKAKEIFKFTMIGAALLLGGFVVANALQSTLCELLNNCAATPVG